MIGAIVIKIQDGAVVQSARLRRHRHQPPGRTRRAGHVGGYRRRGRQSLDGLAG
jgi:hypothetical protein